MRRRPIAAVLGLTFALATLTGCASLFPPSPDTLARLPVVTFPQAPPAGDFVFRLPAGKPIPTRIAIEGTALASGAEQNLSVTLPHDLYIHKRWVSEDGKNWKRLGDALAIQMSVSLPSDEHPKPGEIVLRIDRKDAQ